MPNIWNDLVKWVQDASKVAGKEAGDLTLRGRLKLEIFDLKRKLRDNFHELGSLVYELAFLKKKEVWKTNPKIIAVVKRIKTVQRQLKVKNLEYKKVGAKK